MWKSLHQFAPSECELPTLVANINVMLRTLTLNVNSEVTTPISIASRVIVSTCVVTYYYAYYISLAWFLMCRPHQDNFLLAAIVFVSLAMSSNIAVIKLGYMIAHRSKMSYLVDQCMEVDALTEPGSRFHDHMMVGLKSVKLMAITFWACVNVIAVFYIHIPTFLPGRHLPEDLLVFLGLDPWNESPNYEISYLIMALSVYFICYTVSVISAFIIIIIGYASVQMTSLAKEIRHIWNDAVQDAVSFKVELIYPVPRKQLIFDDDTKSKIDRGVRERLINIMQRHSRVITLLKDVDKSFNVPNAVAFVSLALSLIAELLGGLENTYLQIPFTLFQVVMDCYIGQKIVDASVSIEEAVYACKWENFGKENMKMVLVMLQNSQRTLKVTAGGVAVMNFKTLMAIVRSVYSTYTTLHSTMRQKL